MRTRSCTATSQPSVSAAAGPIRGRPGVQRWARPVFIAGSGYDADITFTTTTTGIVDYASSLNGFLSGRAITTLRIDGLVVILNARYLSGSGVLQVAPLTSDDCIS